MNARFTVGRSHVYGWCVYDANHGNIPAWDAVSEFLPRTRQPDGSEVAQDCTQLKSKLHALNLCNRLINAVENAPAPDYRIVRLFSLWYVARYDHGQLIYTLTKGYKRQSTAKAQATRMGIVAPVWEAPADN